MWMDQHLRILLSHLPACLMFSDFSIFTNLMIVNFTLNCIFLLLIIALFRVVKHQIFILLKGRPHAGVNWYTGVELGCGPEGMHVLFVCQSKANTLITGVDACQMPCRETWGADSLDCCLLETEDSSRTSTGPLFENTGFISWYGDWSCIFGWWFWELWASGLWWHRTWKLEHVVALEAARTGDLHDSFQLSISSSRSKAEQGNACLEALESFPQVLIINHPYLWSSVGGWLPGPGKSPLILSV